MKSTVRVVNSGEITQGQYAYAHLWIKKKLGKPQHCITCGTTEDRLYHWANISSKYKKDVGDWMRLCVPCHSKMDGFGYNIPNRPGSVNRSHCRKGHEMVGSNLYYKPGTGKRECIECRKRYHLVSNAKYRLHATEKHDKSGVR